MTIARTSIDPAWKGAPPRSWFACAPGEWKTLAWIIGIHLAALAGCTALPLPDWPVLMSAGILYALGGLGTTVAYHRALAHRSVVLNPVVEKVLVFLAMLNGSGDPLTWVANHRYHHAHSDTERDLSSPHRGGFWWSHLRWLWQAPQASPDHYCADLVRRGYRRWSTLQVPVLALSLFGPLLLWPLIGPVAALAACAWMGALRLVLALHVQGSVNSLNHLGELGAEHGSAKNAWWMTPLHVGLGENWHENHHSNAREARLGRRWWELDTGWWTIRGLAVCRLARDICHTRRLRTRAI